LLDVAEGLIDVAIVPAELRWPSGVTGEAVGALGWRCFGRQGHAAFRDWGPAAWAHWPHLVVRVGDSLASPVNIAATAAGLERTIAGWVPNFSAIAPILAGSDLLATLLTVAMSETVHAYRLESREVPFRLPPLPHAMVWCSGRSRDPGLIWLRDRLRPIVRRNLDS
jgi:DNA-binding transcriptional LysR family regulator